eukprot:182951-Rhodomonas_salina.1
MHIDVDAFYCAVECIDDPSLVGKPLAVRQFNSGGPPAPPRSLMQPHLPAVLVRVHPARNSTSAAHTACTAGFVAVSYEAKAKGIRKGDGVGAGGRAAAAAGCERLKGLVARVSREEALHMCPDLQIRPMRTHRYRQVANDICTSVLLS